MHGVASQHQHHSSGGHGVTHCLYLYIWSSFDIFLEKDRNQIVTCPHSTVFQFSCAIESAEGSALKVTHFPGPSAILTGAQFLGGDGVEATPELNLGGVERTSLLFR